MSLRAKNCKSGHLFFFSSFFEALNDAFEVQCLQGVIIYTVSKTLIACRAMQLRFFFKVETLLNNNPLR